MVLALKSQFIGSLSGASSAVVKVYSVTSAGGMVKSEMISAVFLKSTHFVLVLPSIASDALSPAGLSPPGLEATQLYVLGLSSLNPGPFFHRNSAICTVPVYFPVLSLYPINFNALILDCPAYCPEGQFVQRVWSEEGSFPVGHVAHSSGLDELLKRPSLQVRQ